MVLSSKHWQENIKAKTTSSPSPTFLVFLYSLPQIPLAAPLFLTSADFGFLSLPRPAFLSLSVFVFCLLAFFRYLKLSSSVFSVCLSVSISASLSLPFFPVPSCLSLLSLEPKKQQIERKSSEKHQRRCRGINNSTVFPLLSPRTLHVWEFLFLTPLPIPKYVCVWGRDSVNTNMACAIQAILSPINCLIAFRYTETKASSYFCFQPTHQKVTFGLSFVSEGLFSAYR